jgi:hypothetical protein
MSRYTKEHEKLDIAYGFDRALGYFFQIFDGVDEDGEDNLVTDECTTFTKMSNGRMYELLKAYDCDENHQRMVASDLPI